MNSHGRFQSIAPSGKRGRDFILKGLVLQIFSEEVSSKRPEFVDFDTNYLILYLY